MKRTIFCLALALSACQDGRVTIAVTDAPVDEAAEVNIQFTGVELERNSGAIEHFDFSSPRNVNVLALEGGGRVALVDDETVEPANYRAIRLKILADGDAAHSFITIGDATFALKMADEDAGRLKVAHSFTVDRRDELHFTFDFDLRKSILKPSENGGPYRLVPSLRLLADADTGALRGTVSQTVGSEGCVVYVYSGSGVTPDDVGGNPEPLNTARVLSLDNVLEYRVNLLPAGNYTAALTCEAEKDQPGVDDDVAFNSPQNVTISAGQTTTANF